MDDEVGDGGTYRLMEVHKHFVVGQGVGNVKVGEDALVVHSQNLFGTIKKDFQESKCQGRMNPLV